MAVPAIILPACAAGGLVSGWLGALAVSALAGPDPSAGRKLAAGMAIGCALLFAWASMVTPFGPVLAASLGLAWTLLVLACVDASVFRLPDLLTLPLCAAGLLLAWLLPAADGWPDHLAGSVAGYGFLALFAWGFRRLRGYDGLGMGDAKLMAAAGAWLGWRALPSVLLVGCLGGLVWWLVARLRSRGTNADPRIPFGAPLCAAVWLVWLYGPLEIGG
jgi:leader peptidase (prepilin peptidase)/N-methyltransferase